MTLTDFGVTVNDVLEKIPLDTSQITSTTEPVSTVSLAGFIQDASSDLRGLLERSGLKVDSLGADTLRQMKTAVEAYVVAEALDAMGFMSMEARKYRQKWTDLYDRYSANPSTLADQRSRFKSNVRPKTRRAEFVGTDYEY